MSESCIAVTQSLLVTSLSNKAAVQIQAGDYHHTAHQSLSNALVTAKHCLQLQHHILLVRQLATGRMMLPLTKLCSSFEDRST
jgi:hypothetical protein